MLLGLDLGTTNVKAVVADSSGQVLSEGSVPVRLLHTGTAGVEQDIEEIWQAALTAMRDAARAVDSTRIAAIGISSQGGAMQILDEQHRPIGRVISWLDGRGASDDERLTKKLGRRWFVDQISHGGSALAAGQLARLGREQPGLLPPPNRVGFVGDIVTGRLCGRSAHDGTACALTLLYNPATRDYAHALLQQLGLHAGQLPVLVASPEPAGGLLPEVARQCGLNAGIPVSPAIHDQYAAALGCGAVSSGDVMIGTGTAWVLLAVTNELLPPVTCDALVSHHVVDGLFGQIVSMRNGGSAFTWALKLLGMEKLGRAEIDQFLGSVPPGSGGLILRPLLGPFGATGVKPGTQGCLEGLQFSHTPAHLLRSVVEGLACELNRHLEFLRAAQIPVHRLLMTGGAAASAVTPQIIADVTGLPVTCQGGLPGSLRGALILARGMIPEKHSLRELSEMLGQPGTTIRPGPDAAFYQQQFKKYLQLIPPAPAECF